MCFFCLDCIILSFKKVIFTKKVWLLLPSSLQNMQNTFLCFCHFFEKKVFLKKNLILLHENSFKLYIQDNILNPHVTLHQNPSTKNFFFIFLGVVDLTGSYTVFWKNNRKSWMNGNFRVGGLVHLTIVHNMHQFVFALTQASNGTNAQNIENQYFFSQLQQIRTFYQIQSFQNDF